MIPYGRQDISQADIDAVVEVLRSDWLTQGPIVPRFEQAVANYVGAQHAVAVNSATGALHIACLALGVGPGDWVWTSPNTFVASANCALYCSAKVDFVDIDPRTYNMSVERLAEKLEQAKATNRLPKVVIPVHFAGQPCDMLAILNLSEEYGFKIIEDASHAIGASYVIARSGEPTAVIASREAAWQSTSAIKVGSCTHSHITVFSFHPVKIITTGEGGMALTNDPELAEKMSRLRAHGITNKPELMHSRPPEEIWNYQQIDLGFNYRMTDIQAAIGLSQLQRLDDFVAKRREIAANYDRALSNLSVTTPWQDPRMQSSYHLYPVRIALERYGKRQREVYQAMHQVGVLVNLHYIPVHRQPYYEAMRFKSGDFSEAELFHKEAISLPIYPGLSSDEQDHVIRSLKAVLEI
jgi:UDP-4-amino-4,6-dideoxy-N-acetyl-beta-L-altrosamine transaminase